MFLNISFCSRDIQVYKIRKLAKGRHTLNQILIKYDEKKIYVSANLYQKCLILCSEILLNVLHNLS